MGRLWTSYPSRTTAVLRDGSLITKSAAIGQLGDLGVPDWLADQVRRRRAGEEVHVTAPQRLKRARLARKLMSAGIREIAGKLPPSAGTGSPGSAAARLLHSRHEEA